MEGDRSSTKVTRARNGTLEKPFALSEAVRIETVRICGGGIEGILERCRMAGKGLPLRQNKGLNE